MMVVEGVENDAVFALLSELDSDIAQGYAIAPPMVAADFDTWCRQAHFHPHPGNEDTRHSIRVRAATSGSSYGSDAMDVVTQQD